MIILIMVRYDITPPVWQVVGHVHYLCVFATEKKDTRSLCSINHVTFTVYKAVRERERGGEREEECHDMT